MKFGEAGKYYDIGTSELGIGRSHSIEAWITPAADCPAGAVIVDSYGPGSLLGARLRMGKDGNIEYQTTLPKPMVGEKLPTDRPTHVAGVFDSGKRHVALYVNGRQVAVHQPGKDKVINPTDDLLFRVGAGQDGENRFRGVIHSISVYRPALSEEEVTAAFSGNKKPGGLAASWTFTPEVGPRIDATEGKGTLATPPPITAASHGPKGAAQMWYQRPAREWVEALPFGNGRMGGTVYGGIERERIQLNEDTIWSGAPYDPANPKAPDAIRRARKLIFDGKREEAEALVAENELGIPPSMVQYQTLGSVMLDFAEEKDRAVTDYWRSLDLDAAIATTTFRRGGVTYTREVFSSAPDQAVVIRLTADQPASLSFQASWQTPFKDAVVDEEDGVLTLSGKGGDNDGKTGAIRFKGLLRTIPEGGSSRISGNRITIEKADAVTLLATSGTNFVSYKDLSADSHNRAAANLAGASAKSYTELRERHVKDHHALFRRVSLDLGRTSDSALPTDERIRKFTGANDPALPALQFQYGRYLLISCSRPGTQPANLQGMWNDALTAAWGGKYTININTEMNYWPAEVTNLSECAEPLFQLVRDISVAGARTAKGMYEARGWVTHHNTDLWRATAPVDSAGTGMWPTGGAWL